MTNAGLIGAGVVGLVALNATTAAKRKRAA